MSDDSTMQARFEQEIAEVKEAMKGKRLRGFALIAVLDDGRELATAWTLERTGARDVDDELVLGLGEVGEALEG